MIIDLSEFRRHALDKAGKTSAAANAMAHATDAHADTALLAMLAYVESEVKRLGIADAATFIACATEIVRDTKKAQNKPGKIKG